MLLLTIMSMTFYARKLVIRTTDEFEYFWVIARAHSRRDLLFGIG